MPPIEFPVFLGASLAKWRRILGPLSVPQILQRILNRISSPLLVWYRRRLALAFKLRNFLRQDAPLRVKAGGVSFLMAPEGPIAFDVWLGIRQEPAEVAFVLRILRPGMTFFDVGASSGLFSLAAGQKLRGRAGALFAFEPRPSTFAILEKNLRLNHLPEIHAVRAAIGDTIGEPRIFVNPALKDPRNLPREPGQTDAEVVGRERIQTITLDEFVAREGISEVDILKVAAEGAELLVFRGGQQLLARPDAPVILYEGYSWCTAAFHYHPVELMWFLEKFGYEIFVLDTRSGRPRRRSPGEGYDAMVVAVKPSHPAFREVSRGKAAA